MTALEPAETAEASSFRHSEMDVRTQKNSRPCTSVQSADPLIKGSCNSNQSFLKSDAGCLQIGQM